MARTTTLQERTRILEWAQAGMTNQEIATEMKLSPYTVRKWRRRHRQGGRAALASTLGRPPTGAMTTFSASVRQTLLRWRKDHPGWGAKTLHAQLEDDLPTKRQRLPSPATIGRLLKAEHLTRGYHHHRALPQPKTEAVTKVHQRWQLDAKGNEDVPDLGTVALINLSDTFSRARLLSFPCLLDRPQGHPTTEDYQLVLRLAFSHWGLPEELQVDHESVFVDTTSQSPYPTRLHLWLLALGVDLVFAEGRPPNAQALIERSHQLWQRQVVDGQHFRTWSGFFEALLARRAFLNGHLPCASLDEQPPLVAYPEAAHSGRWYRPEIEYDLLSLDRVDAYLAKGRWYRLASKDATVRLGGQVYYVGVGHRRVPLEVVYAASQRQLLFQDETGAVVAARPIKGFDRATLLGELEPYVRLPSFQLQFPFSWSDQRGVRLCEQMGV